MRVAGIVPAAILQKMQSVLMAFMIRPRYANCVRRDRKAFTQSTRREPGFAKDSYARSTVSVLLSLFTVLGSTSVLHREPRDRSGQRKQRGGRWLDGRQSRTQGIQGCSARRGSLHQVHRTRLWRFAADRRRYREWLP